ncbi:oligosaccharide flippase family protein [Parafrankia sp. BMG5.11]|uniref:oligosaccharide flippase family protein n=1 Tax=Parafrankia sp. BMG5.11 TaxID=222540 RepID=UPI0010388745|nr:oligosaccharide flippase family protein [Parafrankia sp. BMG5.11]TCJ32809.1 hypothetical protein E0504_41020 [Parafrankia sp. BMG5.11]
MRFYSSVGYLRRVMLQRVVLFTATAWITAQHGIQQILRLGTNVILARLLAPELLGVMLLINTLRTGGELLSDLGIGQSIVSDPRGRESDFYNTAWTIQILRGLVLFVAALLAASPLADLYDSPELGIILPIAALVFLISGFSSPSRFLLQKDMQVKRLAILGIGMAISSSTIHIALALYTPTIWALVAGLLISTAGGTIVSFFLIDWRMHRLKLSADAARSIIGFGKWIFLSSLIYFAAMNFDRLYFADAVSFTILGVYGIARTFADAITQLFIRFSRQIIFPKFAAARDQVVELRLRIIPMRRIALMGMAIFLATLVAVADQFIYLAYDQRYDAAAVFLPILLVGTWFAVLASAGEAMMLGIGKSSGMAASNATKLAIVVVTVPIILPIAGMVAAMGAIVAAEAVRYAVLAWLKRSNGISFIRQDLLATTCFLLAIPFFREFTHLIGFTDGIQGWVTRMGAQVG